jgi:hypothetical protein
LRSRLIWTVVALAVVALAGGVESSLHAQKKKKRPAAAIPEVTRDKVICFALYTVHNKTLKLTAQLYPLKEGEDRKVRLQIKKEGVWETIQSIDVIEDGWTATFKIKNWDDTKDWIYRAAHGKTAFYEGRVRKNPIDKAELVIAGFTGNSVHASHGGNLPKDDIIKNVKAMDADVLFFSGDQVYDHRRHYKMWLQFGRDFGEIIKDRPTITIPDDHDVGQANLWGASGKKSNTGAGHDGGYFMPAKYVQQVERAQTSHLPDPYDPTPVQRGIGVYYTQWNWGRVSFAILEDRKFKTGPSGLIPKQGPRPDHIRNPEYDPKSVDVPEAILLGKRQLKFMDAWGRNWAGADMKVALSQTIFCGGAHIHGKIGGRLHADLDSNGWPQTGRNKAVDAMRKCFALHYAGDQHLATIFHHGIVDFRDANYSFCVPSIANLYLRWWKPEKPGGNRLAGQDPILGDHLDGFGNHVTAWAAANPDPGSSGGKLTTRAAGFGVVRLDVKTRKITMECWPRNVDITNAKAKQYPGWPKTIDQSENYGRKAVAYLPTVKVAGATNPVIEIVDEATGKWIYALRIKGASFRPKVFKKGTYTIKVGEGDSIKMFKGVKAESLDESGTVEVKF